jgi:hypothetical protein
MVKIQCFQTPASDPYAEIAEEIRPSAQHAPRKQGYNLYPKGHEMGAYTILYVVHSRNAGLPKGRESYGNGVPVVVRTRENLVHGE